MARIRPSKIIWILCSKKAGPRPSRTSGNLACHFIRKTSGSRSGCSVSTAWAWRIVLVLQATSKESASFSARFSSDSKKLLGTMIDSDRPWAIFGAKAPSSRAMTSKTLARFDSDHPWSSPSQSSGRFAVQIGNPADLCRTHILFSRPDRQTNTGAIGPRICLAPRP